MYHATNVAKKLLVLAITAIANYGIFIDILMVKVIVHSKPFKASLCM